MKRYYFDIHDGDRIETDEVGAELPDIKRVEREATLALCEMAREALPGRSFHQMTIRARDADGPVLEASFQWKLKTLR
jgi:uncharacterized protein DUF6894